VCLPYEAFFSLDAIVRTAVRMLVTRRRLLEWSPSGDPDRNRTDLAASCRTMWIAPFIALVAVICLTLWRPAALAVALPVLCLWFASPAVAWWISRPLARRRARLTNDQIIFLRKLSRKTWAFFETFVGPEDHWLPPDNYQEHPVAGVAHSTSPTNMGVALLANLSAYDFGYISAGQLIKRTSNALRTMETLERHRGHFYNWYDTQSLKPLQPMYISTVDSGNLAAHLLTLRPGLLALPDQRILRARFFDGLNDTLKVLMDTMEVSAPVKIVELQKDLESASDNPPTTLAAAWLCLDKLATSTAEMVANFDSYDADRESKAKWWALAFAGQCQDAIDELMFLAPWIVLPATTDRLRDFPGIGEIPTLRDRQPLHRRSEREPHRGRSLGARQRRQRRRRLPGRQHSRHGPSARRPRGTAPDASARST
jgi:hypothetical protein